MSTSRNKKKIRWSRIFIFSLLIYVGYVSVSQETRLSEIHQEIVQTRAKVEYLQEQNRDLEQKRDQLNTNTEVERIARQELGLVKPGETPYIQKEKR